MTSQTVVQKAVCDVIVQILSTFCNLCSQFKGKSQGVKCVIELKSGDEKFTVLIYDFMFLSRRMLAVKLSREKA